MEWSSLGRPYRVEQEVSAPFSVSTSLTCGQDIKNKINKVLLLVVFNAVTRLAAVDQHQWHLLIEEEQQWRSVPDQTPHPPDQWSALGLDPALGRRFSPRPWWDSAAGGFPAGCDWRTGRSSEDTRPASYLWRIRTTSVTGGDSSSSSTHITDWHQWFDGGGGWGGSVPWQDIKCIIKEKKSFLCCD